MDTGDGQRLVRERRLYPQKMPREKVQGYKTYWPGIRYTEMELLQMDSKPIRLVANSLDIARLDAVLEWIYLVDNVDQRWIIWQRAKRYPWRLICKDTAKPVER